jgi:hypothetical protein
MSLLVITLPVTTPATTVFKARLSILTLSKT